MGTSGTESCEGCLQTQFKHLPPQLASHHNLFNTPRVHTIQRIVKYRSMNIQY